MMNGLAKVQFCEVAGAERVWRRSDPWRVLNTDDCSLFTDNWITDYCFNRGFCALAATAALSGLSVFAQPTLPPDALQQFQEVIGNRVEAVSILGGDYAAAGGIYTFRSGSLADLSITKIGGGGAVASPRPLDLGGLQWAPVLQGNLGMVSAVNTFQTGYLAGNRMTYDTLAIAAGGGVAIYFTEHLSLSPTISGMYGRVQNKFDAHNANGDLVKSVGSGTIVDWTLDTWSVVPALELDYEWQWGRTTFDFSSRATFFYTKSFESSSPIVGVKGDSTTWANKLDVDVPLGLKVFGRELHTGGFFSRTELFGDAAHGLNTDYLYTANGRLVFDFLGKLWKVKWLGLGVSYFWGHDFSGWSGGLDLRFQF
jgi:hypothetical protein